MRPILSAQAIPNNTVHNFDAENIITTIQEIVYLCNNRIYVNNPTY